LWLNYLPWEGQFKDPSLADESVEDGFLGGTEILVLLNHLSAGATEHQTGRVHVVLVTDGWRTSAQEWSSLTSCGSGWVEGRQSQKSADPAGSLSATKMAPSVRLSILQPRITYTQCVKNQSNYFNYCCNLIK